MDQTTADSNDAGTTAERWATFIRKQAARFESSLDEALATGDTKAIHGLRVASRRLNEPLTVGSEWIGRRQGRRLRRELKRIRGAFREVRDLDVVRGSLLAATSSSAMQRADLAELEARITEQRERVFADAVQVCRDLKPHRTIRILHNLAAPATEEDASFDASLRARLLRRMGEVAHDLAAGDPRRGDETDLHPARIQVKRLRYAAELAGRLGLDQTDRLIESLAHLQNLLGTWNDHVTAARWLATLARRRSVLVSRASWSGRLFGHAAERARAAAAQRERILDEWANLVLALGPSSGESDEMARMATAMPIPTDLPSVPFPDTPRQVSDSAGPVLGGRGSVRDPKDVEHV